MPSVVLVTIEACEQFGILENSLCESVSEKILQWKLCKVFISEIIHLSDATAAKPRGLMNKLKQVCENMWRLASNVALP